ncbi:unnamed protein product [Prorocentrum cordatum]|uniref:Subtilisin n=1 Tax=Prorocentrum cordatum TaxID=2364126 RepID=A0ABN9TCQ2_9DINO|nr:unnamed protein product [Polarella glacialis]
MSRLSVLGGGSADLASPARQLPEGMRVAALRGGFTHGGAEEQYALSSVDPLADVACVTRYGVYGFRPSSSSESGEDDSDWEASAGGADGGGVSRGSLACPPRAQLQAPVRQLMLGEGGHPQAAPLVQVAQAPAQQQASQTRLSARRQGAAFLLLRAQEGPPRERADGRRPGQSRVQAWRGNPV